MKKILVLMIMGIFLMSFVSSLLIVTQNIGFDISHPIRIDGEVDSNIVANITVKDPDNLVIATDAMVFDPNTLEHNITLNSGNSSKIGLYDYCISANNGSAFKTDCFQYQVTITGDTATTSQSIIYSFLGILGLVFFGLSLLGAIMIPWKNPRNAQGIIVGMNDLKYVKLFLWFFTYLTLIFITFAFRHVARIANWDVGGNWLNFMFWFLIVFLFPVFVITFLTGFISYFDDKKNWDLIQRGFKVR